MKSIFSGIGTFTQPIKRMRHKVVFSKNGQTKTVSIWGRFRDQRSLVKDAKARLGKQWRGAYMEVMK